MTPVVEVLGSHYIMLLSALSFSNNLCFAEFSLRALLIYRYLHPSSFLVTMSTLRPPSVDLNDDRSPQLIKSVFACCVLSGLAVAGRLASRKIQKSNFRASDYLVAAGLVGSWVISGMTMDGEQSCLNPQRRHLMLILFSGFVRPWQAC